MTLLKKISIIFDDPIIISEFHREMLVERISNLLFEFGEYLQLNTNNTVKLSGDKD